MLQQNHALHFHCRFPFLEHIEKCKYVLLCSYADSAACAATKSPTDNSQLLILVLWMHFQIRTLFSKLKSNLVTSESSLPHFCNPPQRVQTVREALLLQVLRIPCLFPVLPKEPVGGSARHQYVNCIKTWSPISHSCSH